ncbi:hypothetical protein IEQ34_011842 [Dendrobium chrysotoxum]|uniref:Uncharacterized protein n=1 Tax=Dendrobium chrysotoxum TaxID=161865 RepID=A0AAV7GTL0_DENCH|nr:hypothetical protein IEQ34_011842 [Dendrobium chrysotoxum]
MSNECIMPIPGFQPRPKLSFFSFREAQRNPTEPMIAPTFPAAPAMPWHVHRNRAGKSSAGTMKVVVLGPKLEKKKVKA